MKYFLTILLGLACVAAGACKKKPAAAPAPESDTQATAGQAGDPAAPQPEAPPPPPSQEVKARAENAPRQSITGEVDPFLTGELRKFIEQKQRLPATFAEFSTTRLDSVPRPPQGKKWAIDTESLEVKAVSAQ